MTQQNIDVNDVASCLDNWFSPFIYTYTREAVSDALDAKNIKDISFLSQGLVWDSNNRLERFPNEKDLMGTGDIRLIAHKGSQSDKKSFALEGYNIVTETDLSHYSTVLRNELVPAIREILADTNSDENLIMRAYTFHRCMYDEMSSEETFDIQNVLNNIKGAVLRIPGTWP